MDNVIQTYNDDDVQKAAQSRQARQTIGTALAKAYKYVPWHVDVNLAGGIATISCPKISLKFGMVLHLTRDTLALEAGARKLGGELLERFMVSRNTGDFSSVKRNIQGEALGAARGEQ